jgi:hypothetical protein
MRELYVDAAIKELAEVVPVVGVARRAVYLVDDDALRLALL